MAARGRRRRGDGANAPGLLAPAFRVPAIPPALEPSLPKEEADATRRVPGVAAVGVEGAIVPARPAEVRATGASGRPSSEAVAITAQVLARRRGGARVLVIEPLTEVMTPLGRRGPGHFL